MLAESTASRRF